MLEIASQMILCLLLAALLGFIIGYLFGKMTCANDDCGHDTDLDESQTPQGIVHTTENSTSNTSATVADLTSGVIASTLIEPALLSSPRDGKADNLSCIKGIGAKIEEELNNAGIYHFDQIAAWTSDNISWADDTLGFPGRAARENWVEQSKILAAGEETEFSKRVDAGEVESSKQA